MWEETDAGLRGELIQLRLVQDDILHRLADAEIQIAVAATRIQAIEARILHLVSTAEFMPVKWTFYGTIGSVLAAMLTALIASMVAGVPHTISR